MPKAIGASLTGDRMNEQDLKTRHATQHGDGWRNRSVSNRPGRLHVWGSGAEKRKRNCAQSSLELLKEHENYIATLEAGEMIVQFDLRYGSISSITRKNDPFETNYIGNEINTPGVDPANSLLDRRRDLDSLGIDQQRLGQECPHRSQRRLSHVRQVEEGANQQIRRHPANQRWRRRCERPV